MKATVTILSIIVRVLPETNQKIYQDFFSPKGFLDTKEDSLLNLICSRHIVYDLDYESTHGRRRMAGCAFQTDHYGLMHLRLNLFEPRTFFVVKNTSHKKGPDYWVLSRLWIPRKQYKEPLHFQIGEGAKMKHEDALKIYLYDIDRYYEINLKPDDHYTRQENVLKPKERA